MNTLGTLLYRRWLRRLIYALAAFNVVLAGAALGIRAQDSAEPYTADAALEAFRAASGAETTPTDPTPSSAPATPGAGPADAATSTETSTDPAPAPVAPAAGDPSDVDPGPGAPAAAPPDPGPAEPSAGDAPSGDPNAEDPAPPAGGETSPAPASSGGVDGSDSSAAAAPAFPDNGVYVYATDGHEEVDALGGARHDYPDETTMTWRSAGCGAQVVWQPLEERAETQQFCPAPGRHRIEWVESTQAFFGQSQTMRLTCEESASGFVVGSQAGDSYQFSCDNGDTFVDNTVDILAVGPRTVAGTTVDAVEVRIRSVASGGSQADMTQQGWFRRTDGLTLSLSSTMRGSAPGPGGNVNYFEQYTLDLQSLEPLR